MDEQSIVNLVGEIMKSTTKRIRWWNKNTPYHDRSSPLLSDGDAVLIRDWIVMNYQPKTTTQKKHNGMYPTRYELTVNGYNITMDDGRMLKTEWLALTIWRSHKGNQ